jgi:1,2-dihydroxy-3-keto-5-methylthiopentene dioxygenase
MKACWLESNKPISADELNAQGIFNVQLPVAEAEHKAPLEKIMKEHAYVDRDQVNMSREMPKFDEICRKFSIEHYHPGDEVRFILSGSGVWEIRSLDDRWMKVEVVSKDFITVPSDRYHRFYLTDEKKIQCVRLFKDHNGWVQVYRKDVEAKEKAEAEAAKA